jgi:rhodanese-related sulfurtransferase
MPVKNPQEPFTRLTVAEAKEMIDNGAPVIDVREMHEYTAGHVPGAKLIPVNTIMRRSDELPKEGPIVFICAMGQRSALACEMAAAMGFKDLYNVEGGTNGWIEAGYPVE